MKRIFKLSISFLLTVCLLFSFAACGETEQNPNEPPVIAVQSVQLDRNSLSLEKGESAKLSVLVQPDDATDKEVIWLSSNSAVATVADGLVLAVGAGEAEIRATVGGKSDVCALTVTEPTAKPVPVTKVTLDREEVELTVGETVTLTATLLPSDATDKTVNWTSDDPSVATVENGLVTAASAGTTAIKATAANGISTSCTVSVSERTIPVKRIDLDRETLDLIIGESDTLTATVYPANATDQTVSWSSDNNAVATVENGVVYAVSVGSAKITAMTSNGIEASCAVTVSTKPIPVTGIVLDPTKLTLEPGKTATITATVSPAEATDKSITWTSTNDSIATVDGKGLVTAVRKGSATIKAVTSNYIAAVCTVTVYSEDEDDDGSLSVAKVPSLQGRDDFIMGMDASAVPSLERAGVKYRNFDGQVEDVYKILADNGVTDIRIRIWNDPYDNLHNGYGGGNCDVPNAVAISKRCAKYGLGVILDFHYSDFWADPGKQKRPKAWAGYSKTQVADAIYEFTKDTLRQIEETNVKITMVQIGNETTSGLCGATTSDWPTMASYMKAGSRAVREVTGQLAEGGAKVAIHVTNPESQNYLAYANNLDAYQVDYDVFGSSYYSFWHGTLTNLASKLKSVHDRYGKEVIVLETSHPFTMRDSDGMGNTYSGNAATSTVQGQADAVRDVIATIADLGDWGLGICYWEGTWIAASTSTNGQTNASLCLQYGCGWATYHAHTYDSSAPSSPNQWASCVIDNQAFFLSDGTPIDSLKIFKRVF